MNQYTNFAYVYDEFMSNIPYEEWADRIDVYLLKLNKVRKILELGCGTGSFTLLMKQKGYDILGIDCSEDMLKVARKKAASRKIKCEFKLQDMRALELEEKFDCVVSVCDSMNYMTDEFDLESALEGVYRVLNPNGIFVFDMKTENFYKGLGNNIFVDETSVGDYVWKNYYDSETRDNSYELDIYIRQRKNKYLKHTEEHLQHAFTKDEVLSCADKCGFVMKEILGMDLLSPGDYNAERVYYVLERKNA